MSIEEGLYGFLCADSGITALVASGSPLIWRIYNTLAPESPTYPYITYQPISNPREHTLAGEPYGATPRYQISAYARTAKDSQALAQAIETALDGIGSPFGTVQASLVVDKHTTYEEAPKSFQTPVDVVLYFNP